jgi:7-cyano-7-deazaguanine synthase
LHGDKESILLDALDSTKTLGFDFDTVLQNTITSYNPDDSGRSSGTSGSDIERVLAFHAIGRKDPIPYILPWENILSNALMIEKQFKGDTHD